MGIWSPTEAAGAHVQFLQASESPPDQTKVQLWSGSEGPGWPVPGWGLLPADLQIC